jgi:hypothetical protein
MPAQYPADVYNRDDETLLKFLQGGGAGRGPEVDKAIQDLLKQRGASGFAKQAYDFDPQRQNTPSAVDPLRDPGAYASTGFNTSQATKIQSAQTNYFQDFLNSLSPEERSEIEGFGDLSEEDKKQIGYDYAARQQLNFGTPLAEGEYASAGGLYYTPEWGEYGGYLTKQNPDAEQVARVRDMMAQQAAGTADPSWANQNLSGLISTSGLGGWHVRGATENDPEVQKYGIYNVGRSDYMQTRRNEALQKNIELLKQQASQGIQPSQEFLEEYIAEGGEGAQAEPQYNPRGEELGDVASILPPAMTQGDLYRAIQERGSSSPGTKEYGELRDLQKEWIQRQQKLKGAEAPQEFLEEYIAEGGEGAQAEPQYGPRGEDLGEVAVQYGDGFPKTPEWMKQLEREYNKTKGKPLSPGTPKPGRGMGDVWEGPVRDASAPKDTDYSIATALSGSDEQRQKQTFQAEYDPQKAQTAQAAAKAYKKSAATEDPFRSQAIFG